MIFNKDSNKPRGYAFIEYEHERDMHCECCCVTWSAQLAGVVAWERVGLAWDKGVMGKIG